MQIFFSFQKPFKFSQGLEKYQLAQKTFLHFALNEKHKKTAPADISPDPVDGFSKFKRLLEAEKFVENFCRTEFLIFFP